MAAGLDISRVDVPTARTFWEQQRDARIFVHPDVLEPLCAQVDWWLARWNGHAVCLWPVCHAPDGRRHPPELSAYVGAQWSDAMGEHRIHRWWTLASQITEGMLGRLRDEYGAFSFELPPGTRDVRMLQWFAADQAERTECDIEVRHTAVIPAQAADELVANFSRNRQRDLRRGALAGFVECSGDDHETVYALYEEMLRGKLEADKAQRRRREVAALVDIARSGYGHTVAYRDGTGALASFTLVLGTRQTALQLLIVSSKAARDSGLQAIVQLQAITRSFERGATLFDFVGGNSRIGAEEKHRYGGRPDLYFRVGVGSR